MRQNPIRSSWKSPPLLVQCCHLPQFFFIAEKLAQELGGPVDALLNDHPDAHLFLKQFPNFRSVHFYQKSLPEAVKEYDDIVFPLLNRGYARLKRSVASTRGRHWEVDYGGRVRPLSRGRLFRSFLLALHEASVEFSEYLKSLPHRPMGKRVLFLESCHKALIESTRGRWEKALPTSAEVTRISDFSYIHSWKSFREKHFDAAIVFFSGETGFLGLKLLPFLLRIGEILVINEHGNHFYANRRALARFLFQRLRYGGAFPKPDPLILLVQTEGTSYVREAASRLKRQRLYPNAEIALLCREEDLRDFQESPDIDHILPLKSGKFRLTLKTFRTIWQAGPDFSSAVFSGRKVFTTYKVLFFLLGGRRRLVFNAALDCYWLTLGTLPRLLRRDSLLYYKDDLPSKPLKVLLFQTESWQYTLHAIESLKRPQLFPRCQITLVCRGADRARFLEEVSPKDIVTFRRKAPHGLLKLRRRLKGTSPDIVSAVFTGRRGFWKQKLFFLLSHGAPKLVFNSRLDCYWLSIRTFPRIFRQEPLLFETAPEMASEVLLIQTEEDDQTLRAVKTILSGRVVPNRRIAVFCALERRRLFERLPVVEKVYTYEPRKLLGNLKTLWRMVRRDRDVVAALFTGRPIYRLQKLLFFALPARHRLVFNENLDCFYLKRGRFSQSLRLPSLAASLRHKTQRGSGLNLLVRQTAKMVLFIPRFLYLLLWITFAKLKRSYLLLNQSRS